MEKHTKRPWKISEHLDTGESVVRDADDIIVANCGVDQWEHRREPEMKANAKLIAAAPDLLIACKAAFEQLQVYGLVTGEGDLMDTLNNTINEAEGK